MSKRLGGNIDYKDRISSWHLIGFPDGINGSIGSTQCTLYKYCSSNQNFLDKQVENEKASSTTLVPNSVFFP